MANTIYKRMDNDAMIYFVNYLLNKLKTSPLSDNTTYTIEKSVNGKSFALKDDAGNTISTIGGLITDAERTKLGQDLATESYVNQQIAATGHIQLRKVQSLPPIAEASTNIIYLVPISGDDEGNNYMEYYLQDGEWENLGSTKVDLSGYVQASEMSTLSNAEITTIVNNAYDTVFPTLHDTVLYSDGTLVFQNQRPADERHGTIVAEYDDINTISENNNRPLWASNASDILAVEFLDNVSPINVTQWFRSCNNLVTIRGIHRLDTSNLNSMASMFQGCSSLTSLDVSNFITSRAGNLTGMFQNCSSLTTLDISNFNIPAVNSMSRMFWGDSQLRTIYASDTFYTGQVVYSDNMFYECTSLVGGYGTTFDSNHTDKTYARIDKQGTPGYFSRYRDPDPEPQPVIPEP